MYSSAKIAWWREHQPNIFNRIETFVSAKAFVLQRLTGTLLEDRATVSGSGMLNVNKLDWEDKDSFSEQRLLPTTPSA